MKNPEVAKFDKLLEVTSAKHRKVRERVSDQGRPSVSVAYLADILPGLKHLGFCC